MAIDNLKDFSIQWITFGLLFLCLLTFATYFTAQNNPSALGPEGDKLSAYQTDIQSNLITVEGSSNALLNISAQNNPEVSDLGSKDSVATSYGIMGIARTIIGSMKLFFGWIFTGTSGLIIISIFVGVFGLTALYFITKWIRNGV